MIREAMGVCKGASKKAASKSCARFRSAGTHLDHADENDKDSNTLEESRVREAHVCIRKILQMQQV